MWRTFILTILLISILCSVSQAADLRVLYDKFYTGIADVIERNMDDPQQCLREVDKYFEKNQALVAQIRSETEKAMTRSAPMMQKMMGQYQSMSEKELAALEKKSVGSAGMEKRIQSQMSPAMTRYSKVADTFMEKYPQYAMQLAGKMMQLIPSLYSQMQMQQGWY